jgi:hypothetical protein
MFSIIKEWKEYDVDLADLHTWLKANAGVLYTGSSADYVLTVWFSEEPSEEIKTAVDGHWNGLTSEGEAAKITHRQNLDLAVVAALDAIPLEDWADMIPAERKLAMGRTLTDSDREALLVKYPV